MPDPPKDPAADIAPQGGASKAKLLQPTPEGLQPGPAAGGSQSVPDTEAGGSQSVPDNEASQSRRSSTSYRQFDKVLRFPTTDIRRQSNEYWNAGWMFTGVNDPASHSKDDVFNEDSQSGAAEGSQRGATEGSQHGAPKEGIKRSGPVPWNHRLSINYVLDREHGDEANTGTAEGSKEPISPETGTERPTTRRRLVPRSQLQNKVDPDETEDETTGKAEALQPVVGTKRSGSVTGPSPDHKKQKTAHSVASAGDDEAGEAVQPAISNTVIRGMMATAMQNDKFVDTLRDLLLPSLFNTALESDAKAPNEAAGESAATQEQLADSDGGKVVPTTEKGSKGKAPATRKDKAPFIQDNSSGSDGGERLVKESEPKAKATASRKGKGKATRADLSDSDGGERLVEESEPKAKATAPRKGKGKATRADLSDSDGGKRPVEESEPKAKPTASRKGKRKASQAVLSDSDGDEDTMVTEKGSEAQAPATGKDKGLIEPEAPSNSDEEDLFVKDSEPESESEAPTKGKGKGAGAATQEQPAVSDGEGVAVTGRRSLRSRTVVTDQDTSHEVSTPQAQSSRRKAQSSKIGSVRDRYNTAVHKAVFAAIMQSIQTLDPEIIKEIGQKAETCFVDILISMIKDDGQVEQMMGWVERTRKKKEWDLSKL